MGEVSLAKQLVDALHPGMLCLADRGFTAHPLFSAAAARGADLLWRAKGNAVLPVLERFPDGSFRSELVATGDKRARYSAIATPFEWRFTRLDLHRVLAALTPVAQAA